MTVFTLIALGTMCICVSELIPVVSLVTAEISNSPNFDWQGFSVIFVASHVGISTTIFFLLYSLFHGDAYNGEKAARMADKILYVGSFSLLFIAILHQVIVCELSTNRTRANKTKF